MDPPAQPWPWWRTSLLVGAIAMGLTTLALYLPAGRATIMLITGAVVFAWFVQKDPAFWLRRLAGAFVSAAVVTAAVPALSAALDLGELGSLRLQSEGSGWFVLGFLVAAVALAAPEVWRERRLATAVEPAPQPSAPAPPATHAQAGMHFANKGNIAQETQSGDFVGGDKHTTYNAPITTHNHFPSDHVPPAQQVDVDLQRHLDLLLGEVEHIDIKGISSRAGQSKSALRRPIEELYTPLRSHRELRFDDKGPSPRGERVELPELLRAHHHLLLVGQPGAGKSTFLQLVACMLARDLVKKPPPEGTLAWRVKHLGVDPGRPAWIPGLVKIALLVPLFTEHSKPGRADDRNWLLDLLAVRVCASSTQADAGVCDPGHDERCKQWDVWLREGRVILLLDGLDEVADEKLRERIFTIFSDACTSWPKCPIVVTSRPISIEALQTRGFHVATIDPFEAPEIERYVRQWSQALHEDRDPEASAREARLLLGAIAERHELRRLAQNPVMLTCLCVIHWNEGKLPAGRARVYHAVLNWMLESRDDLRRAAGYSREFAERAFKSLALAMMLAPQGKQKTYSLLNSAEVVDPLVERKFGGDRQERSDRAQRWLVAECEWSHLIEEVGQGRLQFWHYTMQEFAAALELARRETEAPKSWWPVIEKNLDDPQWRATIELFPGCLHAIGDYELVDSLFEKLLALSPGSNLVQDARVLGIVGRLLAPMSAYDYELSSDLKSQFSGMQGRAMAIFTSAGAAKVPPPVRIEAAEALGRAGDPRLTGDNFRELPGKGVLLGTYPVMVAEYKKFVDGGGYVDDTLWDAEGLRLRRMYSWTEPDSWNEQKEHPNRPVVEVSCCEAKAYCRWLSRRVDRHVRLATNDEWKFAASPDGRTYPWGEEKPSPERANFNKHVCAPTPVGVYPAGAGKFGHQDLAGNVWEWCEDGDPEPDAERRQMLGDQHWVKGGSWWDEEEALAAAVRLELRSRFRDVNLGFRVVVSEPV